LANDKGTDVTGLDAKFELIVEAKKECPTQILLLEKWRNFHSKKNILTLFVGLIHSNMLLLLKSTYGFEKSFKRWRKPGCHDLGQ